MFREIRRSERITDEDRKRRHDAERFFDMRLEDQRKEMETYRNIKPETAITFEEIKAFWDNVFDSRIEV